MSPQQGYPASLARLGNPDTYNVILRGAVMAFQSEHNMTINGEMSSAPWNALLRAASLGQNNVNGYTYAVTSKATPETLTIWHNRAQRQPGDGVRLTAAATGERVARGRAFRPGGPGLTHVRGAGFLLHRPEPGSARVLPGLHRRFRSPPR